MATKTGPLVFEHELQIQREALFDGVRSLNGFIGPVKIGLFAEAEAGDESNLTQLSITAGNFSIAVFVSPAEGREIADKILNAIEWLED